MTAVGEAAIVGVLTEVLIVLQDIRAYLEATSHNGHDLGFIQPSCPGCFATIANSRRLQERLGR